MSWAKGMPLFTAAPIKEPEDDPAIGVRSFMMPWATSASAMPAK